MRPIPEADQYDLEFSFTADEIDTLLSVEPADVEAPSSLTYAKNVFVPLTTACRYTCGYCTYYDPPGQAELMAADAVREILERGVAAGCTEALFTFGDKPDDRYTAIHDQLDEWGYNDIHEYLYEICQLALDIGLLPHSNPGDLTSSEIATLGPVNASMGAMLETTAEVPAHGGSRSKSPGQRLQTIRAAGQQGVLFTTGILVGIGEDWRDRAISLLAIKELHEEYGHIQEVIIQNVVPNERWKEERPSVETMRRAVAMARYCLPEEVSVQVPPNLSPTKQLIDCGVDDLGGISPVTKDHINPTFEWPELRAMKSIAAAADIPLRERLPIYAHHLEAPLEAGSERVPERILSELTANAEAGRRYRRVLRTEQRV